MSSVSDDIPVHSSKARGMGTIRLQRPAAINALTVPMLHDMQRILDQWRNDPDVSLVLLTGEGERGFCAGGDIRALYEVVRRGGPDAADEFFRTEYTLDEAIASYPTTVVSFADGATMGGGVGLAGAAHIRIVTDTTRMAMPETRIGFSPDAGGSWLLGRAPGRLGEYLALTSDAMGGADAIHCGFADTYVPQFALESLAEALQHRADPSTPTELVMLFDETPETGPLEQAQEWIDEDFSADTLPEIIERLTRRAASGSIPADAPISPARALNDLAERSPVALTIALAAVRSARALRSRRNALEQEYHLMTWFLQTQPDLLEGIRAQVIDKDRSPRWTPATLAEVPEDLIGEAFTYRAREALFGPS